MNAVFLAPVLLAAVVAVGLVVRRKLRQIERGTSQMQTTLTSHGYGDLPEPRTVLPNVRPSRRNRVPDLSHVRQRDGDV